MTDALSIPLIIACIAVVIICTGIVHSVNERNPLFILAVIFLIISILVLGLTALLSFLALLSATGG